MRSKQPYLLRALYEWMVDGDLTPYLLVEVVDEEVRVPQQYVQDGRIVLNISPSAVRQLDIGDAWLSCEGRFSGRPFLVEVPMRAVRAIYAKENGDGMMFDGAEYGAGDSAAAEGSAAKSSAAESAARNIEAVEGEASEVAGGSSDDGQNQSIDGAGPNAAEKNANHLKVVK